MKQPSRILFSALLSIIFFAAITYSSCTKDSTTNNAGTGNTKCGNTICYNGGTCNAGFCVCPMFYGGAQCQYKPGTVTLRNNASTAVSVTIYGTTSVVPLSGTITYPGVQGGTYDATARAFGALGGDTASWTFSAVCDTVGSITYVNVPADYFFLKITNKSTLVATQIIANAGQPEQRTDAVSIPADSITYNIGYYKAKSTENVVINCPTRTWAETFGLLMTLNQVKNITLD